MAAGLGAGGSRVAGILLVAASALVFSLTGVLTKLIASDVWTIACWRGLLGGAAILLYVLWCGRGRPAGPVLRLGWRGWLLASVGSLASLAFIAAFKLTYVANVAVIFATAPFMAAALEWLALRERLRPATLLAAVVAVLGVIVMVSGGVGSDRLLGDALALLMTFGSALYMVLIRAFRDTPVVLAGGVSGLQLFVVGWIVVDPLAVSFEDAVLLTLFGLSFALAVVLWTEGNRRITAAETALLGSAETPFAILLAWLILAELPPAMSFVGGAIVLCAVLTHVLRDLARASAAQRAGVRG